MKVYLVTYDLKNKKSEEYNELFEAIKNYGTWWHHFESVWLIGTKTGSSESIRDALIEKIDENDKLVVFDLEGSWASYNISKKGTDWLRNVLSEKQ